MTDVFKKLTRTKKALKALVYKDSGEKQCQCV